MIDYTTIRSVTEKYIDDNFSTVPVVFENVKTDNSDVEHIETVDHQTDSQPLEIGSTTLLITGILVIQIFTDVGIGTNRAKVIATELEDLLVGSTSGITFMEPELVSVGEVKGKHLYQHNLSISYTCVYG